MVHTDLAQHSWYGRDTNSLKTYTHTVILWGREWPRVRKPPIKLYVLTKLGEIPDFPFIPLASSCSVGCAVSSNTTRPSLYFFTRWKRVEMGGGRARWVGHARQWVTSVHSGWGMHSWRGLHTVGGECTVGGAYTQWVGHTHSGWGMHSWRGLHTVGGAGRMQ